MKTIPEKKPRQPIGAVLARFQAAALPIFRSTFRPDCCIAATRVTMRVLRRYRYHVNELPTHVLVANPAYMKGKRTIEEGARCISIGTPGEKATVDKVTGGWNGHLVAVVEGSWLVDPSAWQFDRPEKQIKSNAIIVTRAEHRFHRAKSFSIGSDDGTTIIYEPTRDRGYIEAIDWQRDHLSVVLAVLNDMEKL